MLLNEDLQLLFYRQIAYGTDPVVPNGIHMPRGSNFTFDVDQKLIDNPQVIADGIERDPALGNKTSGASGDVVPNLNFFPYLQKAITGNCVTTGTGPYVHTSTGLTRGAALLHLFEFGFLPLNLFLLLYDQVMTELHLKCPVEGIFSAGTKWVGTGHVPFPMSAAALDAAPTEITGSAVNYMDCTILENGVDGGDALELDIDIVRTVKEKRPSGKAGEATELRYGKSTVRAMLDVYFESDAKWAKARNGVVTPIKATLVAGAHQTVIDLNESRLQPVGPKNEGEDGVRQKFAIYSVRKTDLVNTPIKIATTCATATID